MQPAVRTLEGRGDRQQRRQVGSVSAQAAFDRRFVAFGREMNGVFRDATELDLPAEIAERCRVVLADEFRIDVSSTDLRESNGQ